MKVLVDTCVWSLALRKNHDKNDPVIVKLKELIRDVRVQMIGPIRQELLSGIKLYSQFRKLKNYLLAFPDFPLQTQDFELAAGYFNINREKGVQGSNTDFLICALSYRYKMPIFTIDKDFYLFKENIPIILYTLSNG